AALCLNLTLCSVIRVAKLRGAGDRLQKSAAAIPAQQAGPAKLRAVESWLARRGYKKTQQEGVTLYSKYFAGFYGSFLTHLALIILLLVGAATIYGAEVQDQVVMPGETLALERGTTVEVLSFQIEDETGKLDYASCIVMRDEKGNESPETVVRVNEPLRFGGYKVYQQTYGTAGAITVGNTQTGGSDTLTLTEPVFLTLDGRNGVYFNALYPGYTQDEDGSVTLVTSTSGAYHDPVYDLRVMGEGQMTAVLAFPGETITLGGVTFTMEAPVSYPGLRIKYLSGVILGALYASFAFIVLALYICFFMRPVCVAVREDGYAIASPKPQLGLQLELESLNGEEP
ncbi:MAG: cytochrome c biogenesis protein ResB, partial [Clostridia bacterium]|nr:cytochrome c biogenesis protein ResB [Clostridia bacterium]